VLLTCLGRSTAQEKPPLPISPKPAASIDLRALGYTGLSRVARLAGGTNVTVDFLDKRHLLVTFNPRRLFSRLPECPTTHADRLIHAVVFDLTTGKVVKEKDWYLHDARRYVWPLGAGRFLLRRLNKLYEVDPDLEEKQLFESPKDLVWVSVTADGGQIIMETAEGNASASVEAPGRERVKISFLEKNSLDVQRVIASKTSIQMEATSAGFADVRGIDYTWLVRFGSALRERRNITRVKSQKAPQIFYNSPTTMLVARCALAADKYNVSAFTVAGKFLWRQRWEQCRYTPVMRRSEEGRRFAVGTMTLWTQRDELVAGNQGPEADDDGLDQRVEVFDTASGKSVLALPAKPPVLGGENFALSPDGRQLAILEDSKVGVYLLPEITSEEQARYAELKSDPDLQLPPPHKNDDKAEPIEISVAKEEPAPDQNGEAKPAAIQPDVGAAAPAAATAKEVDAEPPVITLHTGTQVVALDVVVTDAKGQVVRGLQASDFAVSEDGKPQSLSYFREYADALPTEKRHDVEKPPELPPNIFANFAQPEESASTTVVLLDLLNTSMTDQARAQAELVKFLKTRPKNVSFALFTLSSRLQMIQGFTQNGDILMSAVSGKKASQRYRPLSESEMVLQPSLEAASATARIMPQRNFFVESFQIQQAEIRAVDSERRMYVTVGAFAQLARYLSGIPGRKNLVWLSGSFPLGLYPGANEQSPFLEARTYSDELRQAANLLSEAHVAVYPVNVKGLETDPHFAATHHDAPPAVSLQEALPTVTPRPDPLRTPSVGRTYNAGPIVGMLDENDRVAQAEIGERGTMELLAHQTGGQAFYKENDITEAIQMASEHGANYYALSYTPANKRADGKFRKEGLTQGREVPLSLSKWLLCRGSFRPGAAFERPCREPGSGGDAAGFAAVPSSRVCQPGRAAGQAACAEG
jgi:VWFA-related protein